MIWKDQSATFPTKIAWSSSAIDHVEFPADWHKNLTVPVCTDIVNHSWGYIQVPQELERYHFHKHQNLVISLKFTCQGEGFPNL